MAINPWGVIETMLEIIEREITVSLWKMNQAPEYFDEGFEQYFMHALNSR